MIDPGDLLRHVICPTLERIGLYSPAAANLLLGTALTESTIGRHTCLVQRGGGPALGIWQIEPATHRDCWTNYLVYKDGLRARVLSLMVAKAGPAPDDELVWNLAYATAIARVKYYRNPAPLPAADDLEALGVYWKAAYNSPLGAGTVAHWLDKTEPHRAAFLAD